MASHHHHHHHHHPSPPPPPPPQPPLDHLVQAISSLLHGAEALLSSLNLPTHQPLRHAAARVIQTHFRSFLVRRSRTLRNLLKQSASINSSSSSQPHLDFSAPSLNPEPNPPGVDSSATCGTGITIPPSNDSEQLAIANPIPPSNGSEQLVIDANPIPPSTGSEQLAIANPTPPSNGSEQLAIANPIPPSNGSEQLAIPNPIPPSNGSEQLAIANPIPPSNDSEQLAIANPSSTCETNTMTTESHGNGKSKNYEIKISTYCEVCNIVCTSKEHLDQHQSGRKHKKNLEKLTADHPSGSSNPVTGPQEQNDEGKSIGGLKCKRKIETPEDLESKRKKIVESGTTADAVRTCDVCNVLCNSESSYVFHLAGKKHVAMVKKASDMGQCNAS